MSNEEIQNAGMLSREDRETIGELTNIAMGAGVSTLSVLLGKDVEMTPPEVTEYASMMDFTDPFGTDPKTLVCVRYVKGFESSTAIVIRNRDAKALAEMMLGGESAPDDAPLTDLQMGAVGELMNQMMNSAATSIASVIHTSVEINNPDVFAYDIDALANFIPSVTTEPFTGVQFKLNVGDGEMMMDIAQIMLSSEARQQIAQLMSVEPDAAASMSREMSMEAAEVPMPEPAYAAPAQPAMAASSGQGMGAPNPPRGPQAQRSASMDVDPVTVRPVEFTSFDHQPNVYGEENKNLELVMDVTLNLTVELGKTEISIKDVLELTRGSVIELDRVAGEPVDLMANGKLIAKGEVVVIEDNFGLRITSIVSPADRLRGL